MERKSAEQVVEDRLETSTNWKASLYAVFNGDSNADQGRAAWEAIRYALDIDEPIVKVGPVEYLIDCVEAQARRNVYLRLKRAMVLGMRETEDARRKSVVSSEDGSNA